MHFPQISGVKTLFDFFSYNRTREHRHTTATTCTCTCILHTLYGIYMYMNNHLYRTPQCTKERIRKRKRKKEDTLTYEYTTTPFPTHTHNSLNGLEIVLFYQQPHWFVHVCSILSRCTVSRCVCVCMYMCVTH